eukprot:CAMPEP_0180049652 /NCGR_PEP_ID=MMETSP0985-20121206/143_1 /TAXON_ID=483367 /ORGANISM="non described non described, Strain CCMP 2436" /LENGTH=160 /DNA_ID=CAMNT_0021978663 /DNA_START=336 /DNA_END=815 /DNA_ORIENTATION=+
MHPPCKEFSHLVIKRKSVQVAGAGLAPARQRHLPRQQALPPAAACCCPPRRSPQAEAAGSISATQGIGRWSSRVASTERCPRGSGASSARARWLSGDISQHAQFLLAQLPSTLTARKWTTATEASKDLASCDASQRRQEVRRRSEQHERRGDDSVVTHHG